MKILGLLLLLGWRAFVQATIVPTTSITTSTITTTLTSISTSVLYSTSTVLVYSTVPTVSAIFLTVYAQVPTYYTSYVKSKLFQRAP